jgi:D-3-phosphoglycerate dehydrogenase
MPKVLITTATFAEFDTMPLSMLTEKGIQYSSNPLKRTLRKDEIKKFLSDGMYVGLLAGTEIIDRDVLSSTDSLKVISRVGVGIDAIDCECARERSIAVFNTPGVLRDAVSELTLGLILNVLRHISLHDRHMRSNAWQKKMGTLLTGKTVGIVGFGNVGERVAELVSAFGSSIIYYDPHVPLSPSYKAVSFDELIQCSDIISVHCSASNVLIARKEISMMKKGVYLFNTSRGSVIDEDALYDGIVSGHIAGAGLDVFQHEPYSGPLRERDEVVMTSHIGSYAKESRIAMERCAVLNLITGLHKAGVV